MIGKNKIGGSRGERICGTPDGVYAQEGAGLSGDCGVPGCGESGGVYA